MNNLFTTTSGAGAPKPAAAPNSGEYLRHRQDSRPHHSQYERPGLFRRFLAAIGGALRRGILGKADPNYMKQFTGSDGYWDRTIAAQRGWPREMSADKGRPNHPAIPEQES